MCVAKINILWHFIYLVQKHINVASAEMLDGCVSKFASLVRAREKFLQPQPMVNDCQSGVSPVNHSDSDRGVSMDPSNYWCHVGNFNGKQLGFSAVAR